MLAVTVAAAETLNKNTNLTHLKRKVSPAELENTQNADDTERSQYFIKDDLQHRLGEDFFNQPCITLAKEFLGKVTR